MKKKDGTKHLAITSWDNGWIHIESHDHKWDQIMLTVEEQQELLDYLITHLPKTDFDKAQVSEMNRVLDILQKDIQEFSIEMVERIAGYRNDKEK